MPLILVVEKEQRYVERISEALTSHGWEVKGVDDRKAAEGLLADQSASLVVVNCEVSESSEIIASFSRRSGGPGAVVLIPESSSQDPNEFGADEIVHKPFTDQDIRQAVRRCLPGNELPSSDAHEIADEVAEPVAGLSLSGEARGLTSADIFGDIVSEVESALAQDAVVEEPEAAVGSAEAVVEGAPVAVEARADESIEVEFAEISDEAAEVAVVAASETGETGADEPEEALGIEVDVAAAVDGIEEVDVPQSVSEKDDSAAGREETAAAAIEIELDAEAEEESAVEPETEVAVQAEAVQAEVVEAEVAVEAEDAIEVEEEAQVTAEAEAEPEDEAEAADEAEVAAAAEPLAEPEAEPEPRPDPADLLDARIRKAAEEGERMAASGSRGADSDKVVSPDDLLAAALADIDQSDDIGSMDSEVTAAEIDALVNSVVLQGGSKKSKQSRPAAAAQDVDDEAREEPQSDDWPFVDEGEVSAVEAVESAGDEAAALEVVDSEEVAKARYQTRLKVIWTLIVIVVVALLVFVFSRDAGGGATEIPAAIGGSGKAEGLESTSDDGADAELRRELESQRQQLQEEISKSQSSDSEAPEDQ